MKQFLAHIEKERVAALPVVTAPANIMVVKTQKEADFAASVLMQQQVIGFDTETRPSFTPNTHYKIALLQLAAADRVFLCRLQHIGEHQGLKAVLESPDILKVGLSVKDDFRMLQRWMKIEPQNFVELQNYAPKFGIEDKSLQKIYAIVFGKRISKSQQLSNWEAPILSQPQKDYAAIDAWTCRELYFEFKKIEESII